MSEVKWTCRPCLKLQQNTCCFCGEKEAEFQCPSCLAPDTKSFHHKCILKHAAGDTEPNQWQCRHCHDDGDDEPELEIIEDDKTGVHPVDGEPQPIMNNESLVETVLKPEHVIESPDEKVLAPENSSDNKQQSPKVSAGLRDKIDSPSLKNRSDATTIVFL